VRGDRWPSAAEHERVAAGNGPPVLWQHVELFHLRYFVLVAEELNFSRAARRLHMAASPLSQRIKDLEHELGAELFERNTHRVALTPAGAALVPLARDVVERFTSLPWRLRQAVRTRHGTVFVGIPRGLHPALRERLGRLERLAGDGFTLKRWPGSSSDLAGAVHEGKLAMALVHLPVSDDALEVIEVMAERLGAVVPADRFAGRESVRLRDLSDLSYIGTSADLSQKYFEQLDRDLAAFGVRKRLRLDQSDYGSVAELVSGGIAFSVSMLDPASPMQMYTMDNVAVLPFEDFDRELVTGLAWRKDRADLDGDLAELVELARSVFAEELPS
jgi:DNA-binding transcriptional LysR family regulator